MRKRVLAILLTFVMLMTSVPTLTLADNIATDEQNPTVTFADAESKETLLEVESEQTEEGYLVTVSVAELETEDFYNYYYYGAVDQTGNVDENSILTFDTDTEFSEETGEEIIYYTFFIASSETIYVLRTAAGNPANSENEAEIQDGELEDADIAENGDSTVNEEVPANEEASANEETPVAEEAPAECEEAEEYVDPQMDESVSAYTTEAQNKSANFSTSYTLTGDYAKDIAAVATAQVGKTQSELGYTEAWCADFACDCARLTGMSSSIIPYTYGSRASATYLYKYMISSCNAKVVTTPQAGDLVFYYCSSCYKDGVQGCDVHVGVVVSSSYSVEGNLSSKVQKRSLSGSFTDSSGHTISSGTVKRVYLRPNYPANTTRTTYIQAFASPKGSGYSVTQGLAEARSSYAVGDYVYAWGYLHDSDDNLYSTYGTGSCQLTISIYRPDGTCAHTYSYSDCDNNWIGTSLTTAGTWTIKVEVSGAQSGSTTLTINVLTSYISAFASPKGSGYSLSDGKAAATSTYAVGDYVYAWGYFHDSNNNLYSSYGSKSCDMTISIYKPDGTCAYTYSYSDCDNNWIGTSLTTAGTWTIKVEVSGAHSGSTTYTITVKNLKYGLFATTEKYDSWSDAYAARVTTTTFSKGDYLYVWGALVDSDAQNLYYSFGHGTCNLAIYAYRPDGTCRHSYSWTSMDNAWIGFSLDAVGTWEIKLEITGTNSVSKTVHITVNCSTHTWNSGVVTTAATYTSTGVKTYTCTECGQTKTETIAKLTHNYSSAWSYNSSTHWHACTDSGYTSLKKDEASHTWNAGVVTTAATCTTSGTKTYTCTVCGATKKEIIAALGHSYTYKNNSNGTHTGTCSRCSDTITKAHSYVSGVCSVCRANLKVITQPQSMTATVNACYCFKVEAEGDSLTYQWQYSTNGGSTWTNSTMTCAKTAVLQGTASSKYNGRLFRCVITDASGNTVTSNSAALTVKTVLEITAQPKMRYVKAGSTYSFTVEATGDGLTYQWQYSKDKGVTWSNSTTASGKTAVISGTASISLSSRLYRCVITDTYGNTVTSNSAKLSVLGIKTQPAGMIAGDGESYQFTVKASGVGLTYQWQYSTDNGSNWKNSTMSSAASATLKGTAKTSMNGRRFRCKITDGAGNTVVSKAAVLTVDSTLRITTQPVNMVAKVGVSYSFSVAASGNGLTYQWQYSTDGGSTWTNSTLTCAKTATIKGTTSSKYNGRLFRCVITDVSGNTVTSKSAKLTVSSV